MINRRPNFSESPEFYHRYIERVPETNILQALEDSLQETRAKLLALPGERWDFRYAPGKWSLKEMWVHVADCERILAYRALRIARRDPGLMSEFDQDAYLPYCRAEGRTPTSIVQELQALRQSSLALFTPLQEKDWSARGRVGEKVFTPLALAYIVVGHERHHRAVMEKRYIH
jgi:hypothetical protein